MDARRWIISTSLLTDSIAGIVMDCSGSYKDIRPFKGLSTSLGLSLGTGLKSASSLTSVSAASSQ